MRTAHLNMLMTRDIYREKVIPDLQKSLKIGNIMAVPQLTKIVINCGLGQALADKKVMDSMSEQLAVITGQRPEVTRARKAISSFKLRAGDAIGLKVTLRGRRMYDFLTRLTSVALPRVRDFRGVPRNGFDGNGNYTLGLSEQTIFPELDFLLVDRIRGFEITFVTSTRDDRTAIRLLELLGLPLAKERGEQK